MPGTIVTGTYTSTFTLNDPGTQNSFTVASSGKIAAASGAGIYANSSTAWAIANLGRITAPRGSGNPASSGIVLAAAGTVANLAGGYIGGGYASIYLKQGGTISNAAGATIGGLVDVTGAAGTITNDGAINPLLNSVLGVQLGAGGSLVNNSGASIVGSEFGVYLSSGSLVNAGSITGYTQFSVEDRFGGSVTNLAGGVLYGGHATGVGFTQAAGILSNAGTILGNGGVRLAAGGTITNRAGALINGYQYGVRVGNQAATLINAGTIIATLGPAVTFGSGNDLLVVDPGAVFSGTVDGGTIGTNTLELASAASTGILSGVGTQFVNFGSIVFDPGAAWFLAGNTSGLAGTISGFAAGDTIELTGVTETIQSYAGGILSLAGQQSLTLNLSGAVASGGLSGDSLTATPVAAGTDISLACFAEGTRIRTERGAVAVERLLVGDRVPVVMAGKVAPIVWLGHRRVDCRLHPNPMQVWPICLSAGAFGPGRPFRDLFLSPDHALFVNGVLIPIRYLVNGRTIRQEPRDAVTYWHVELAEHDVLYAEGVPAESYLDTGNRGAFANGGLVLELHADFARRVWEAQGCAPIVICGPQLAAARRRMLTRASVLGHITTDDPHLTVKAHGRMLKATTDGQIWRIPLTRETRNVRLVSLAWVPADTEPDSNDLRMLGVAISRVWLDAEKIDLDDPRLGGGWHPPEQDWRWTDGDASIATAGACELVFEVMMTGTYYRDESVCVTRVA